MRGCTLFTAKAQRGTNPSSCLSTPAGVSSSLICGERLWRNTVRSMCTPGNGIKSSVTGRNTAFAHRGLQIFIFIIKEENFKWHLEAFASELFIYCL